MSERLANLGYLGLIKEVTAGTPLTPTDFIPLYNESLATNLNLIDQNPIYGNKFATFNTIQGQRDHKGDFTVLAEPNTTARLFDMILSKTSTVQYFTFTITSHSASLGATYTNNGVTFTVLAAINNGTTLICSGASAPTSTGSLVYVSGTPTGDITYSAFVAGPYAHLFNLTNDSNSYTIDVSTGNVVKRLFGFKANKIVPSWNGNELQWKVSGSALGSFNGRALASTPTGTNPYTIVLSTAYDPSPTTGLVVGDLIRFYHAGSAVIDATIASIIDGISFTTTTNVTTMVAGDMVYLRPGTVAFTLLSSFVWPKTQFKFGATAVAALAATQTRLEVGSVFEISHDFEKDGGSPRSGSFDPASLVRKTGNISFTAKRFFDTPDDIANMNALTKTAAVISHLSGTTNQYETRITINHLVTDGVVVPTIKSDEIEYSEIKYHTNYDTSDAKGFEVLIINALATI